MVVAAAAMMWLQDWLLQVHHVPAGVLARPSRRSRKRAPKRCSSTLVATAASAFWSMRRCRFRRRDRSPCSRTHPLRTLPDATVTVWLVRGLGTAMLHGERPRSSPCSRNADRHHDWLALVSSRLRRRSGSRDVQPPAPADDRQCSLLIALPLLVLWVSRSERSTRVGRRRADLDVELLALVASEVSS